LSFRRYPLLEQIVFINGPTFAQGVANGKSGHIPCLTKKGIYDVLHNDIQWNHTTLRNLSNFGQTAIWLLGILRLAHPVSLTAEGGTS
jgi:hypothetical protein